MVHWYRNVMSVVPKGKVKEVMAMLKAIHAQEDRQAARDKAQVVTEKLTTMRLGEAATIVRTGGRARRLRKHDCPGVSTGRDPHQQRAGADHARDSTADGVVGNFPDGKSALMLVAARLRHIAGTKWGRRIYLDMSRLSEVEEATAEMPVG